MNRFVIAKIMNTVPDLLSLFRSRVRASVPALAVVSLCAGLGAVSVPSVHAQTTPVYGSVDVQKVARESKVSEQNSRELSRLQQSLENVMGQLQQHSAQYLSAEEIKELSDLYAKDMPTDAEKKRTKALEDKAAAVGAERTKIENNASPTDDIRKRYQEIGQLEQRGGQALQGLADAYRRRLAERREALDVGLITAIRSAVAKVAQEKKLSMVFDNMVAIYSANDITADVVKQINK